MRSLLLITFLLVVNCKLNRVENNHGVPFLDKKQKELVINTTNKNDIIKILGPPSTRSQFNNDLWIYIERKKTAKGVLSFGKKKIHTNNVLILEINNKGLLAKKEFFDISNMQKIKFNEGSTDASYSKKSFVYDFLSSMRQKVNDPLGVRKKRKSQIKQQ